MLPEKRQNFAILMLEVESKKRERGNVSSPRNALYRTGITDNLK